MTRRNRRNIHVRRNRAARLSPSITPSIAARLAAAFAACAWVGPIGATSTH